MPTFVPVVDSETPRSEQNFKNSDYDKHRQFDAPHALHGSKKVDRGWQQGNVGWGVLGSFGSSSKDDSAQVVRKSENGGKMIKNEKGLWVKVKESEVEVVKTTGAGRGGGIPVYGHRSEPNERKFVSVKQFRDKSESPERPIHKENRNSYDRPRRNSGRADSRDRYRDDQDGAHRVRDSDSDRHNIRERQQRDNGRDKPHYDQRRHGDRHSKHGDNHHSDDRRRDRDSRSRSRSRGQSRTHSRGSSSRKSRRDSSESRSRSRSRERGSRRRDRDRRSRSVSAESRERVRGAKSTRDSEQQSPVERSRERSDGSIGGVESGEVEDHDEAKSVHHMDEQEEEEGEVLMTFSAVQVVNRFHEVFSHKTADPASRIASIAELFVAEACIASMKKPSNVYLRGRDAVGESFLKTAPSPVTISKRVFIDLGALHSERQKPIDAPSSSSGSITFCFDLHRAGTAPGLGDKTKDTLLLYRSENAQLTGVWGTVDSEGLSSLPDLTAPQLFASPSWKCAWKIIACDIDTTSVNNGSNNSSSSGMPEFDFLSAEDRESVAVFHNYDHMETWG